MNQNGIVGSTTSVKEPERDASVDMPQAETELPLQRRSVHPQVNTELAKKESDELEETLKKSTGLSLAQVIALEALSQGQSVAESAQMAKVNPGSIYRWMRKDAAFIKHHETVKHDRLAAARTRLAALTDQAIDAVEKQIGFGDGRLGLEFLREMKVTPRSGEEPRVGGRSEAVVEMVQQRLSVTTSESDTNANCDNRMEED